MKQPYNNRSLHMKIPEEMLSFIQKKNKNTSQYIRSLIRHDILKLKRQRLNDDIISPEIRGKSPYTFLARLIRVVDGDTVILEVELGFYVKATVTIRLAGINCPPITTPKGKRAQRFVYDRLIKSLIVVESRKKDHHGRYVGYIYYHRYKRTYIDIMRTGKVINKELVKKGLAEIVRAETMKTEKPKVKFLSRIKRLLKPT